MILKSICMIKHTTLHSNVSFHISASKYLKTSDEFTIYAFKSTFFFWCLQLDTAVIVFWLQIIMVIKS